MMWGNVILAYSAIEQEIHNWETIQKNAPEIFNENVYNMLCTARELMIAINEEIKNEG